MQSKNKWTKQNQNKNAKEKLKIQKQKEKCKRGTKLQMQIVKKINKQRRAITMQQIICNIDYLWWWLIMNGKR